MGCKLIVNADDFGYSEGVNKGIVQAFSRGIVSSTSLMLNQPGTEHALQLLSRQVIPYAGIHLVLTSGKPVSPAGKVPSLVDDSGKFRSKATLLRCSLNIKEIVVEFSAQIKKAKSAGFKITHLDTHHHLHAHPVVFQALMEVARDYELPVRNLGKRMRETLRSKGISTPDCFCGEWFGDAVSPVFLKSLLEKAPRDKNKVMELMTHPGLVDSVLLESSSYTYGRERELAVLCHEKTKSYIRDMGFELCGYDVF